MITPVLLVDGSGNHPWPLVRQSYPKQFSAIHVEKYIFQQSAISPCSEGAIKFAPHITVTNSDFRFRAGEKLTEVQTGFCFGEDDIIRYQDVYDCGPAKR